MSDISHLSDYDGESDKLTTMVPTNDSRAQEDISKPAKPTDNNTSKSKNKNDNRRQSRSRKSDRIMIMDDNTMDHKIIHLSEENLLLKKHLRKQEEKIKLLATKLVRLVGERRNKEKRDEILIEEQKARILEFEHQVANLRDKLQVSRQQLISYTRLIPHAHPPSIRQSSATSITKSPGVTKSKKSILGVSNSRASTRASTTGTLLDHEFTSKVEQLLLEAKAENQALEDQLRMTRERLTSTEREIDRSHKRVKEVEMGHQEELLRLKGQMDVDNDRHKKKKLLSDNIQLIRLQRESRRTSSWLSTMETQCRSLESSLSSATETISQLENQVSTLQDELREGQQKGLTLQKDLEDSGSQLSKMKELEAQLHGLLEENNILKLTNESLVDKTFSNADKARGGDIDETRHLKLQLVQIETTLKSELKSKADLLGSLSQEKARSGQLDETVAQLNGLVDQLRLELRQCQKPVDSSGNLTTEAHDRVKVHDNDDEDARKRREEWEQELGQTQWQLVQVRDELNKTRNLLRTQMTINKEYQREIEVLTQKLDKAETFHHQKLQEFMEILEQRAEQMSMLEKTLEAIHLNNNARIEIESRKEDK